MILAQLPSGELNHTVRLMHDTGLENRIFYISAMYEFSHSLDPKATCAPWSENAQKY